MLLDNQVDYALLVGIGEFVVDGEAEDGVGHAGGVGEILAGGAGQAAVGGEVADEGIEVAAGEDALSAQLVEEFVARHAVVLSINEDGEVAVVVAHAGHVVPEVDTVDGAQGLTVTDGDLMTGLDAGIHQAQVQQAVGGAHLVHLAVDAWGHDLGLAGKAEVLQIVYALLGLGIVHDKGTALDGVIDLGGVETQGGHVALVEDALTIHLDAEGVGGVVDDAQTVLVGNVLNLLGAARLAIDVDGHDGGGARRDGRLDTVGVDAAGGGVDIYEHGLDAVPPDGVRRRHKAVRCGDDLAADVQRLQCRDERQGAIGEQADVGHLEVLAQGSLEALVEVAVVGDPLAVPNLAQHRMEVVKVGQQRRGDGDDVLSIHRGVR